MSKGRRVKVPKVKGKDWRGLSISKEQSGIKSMACRVTLIGR